MGTTTRKTARKRIRLADKLKSCGIEVRYMGNIERGGHYRRADGYSVFVDGHETQPWQIKRDAMDRAKRIARDLGCKIR